MQVSEKLGSFYLGRRYDQARGEVVPEPILYDAKDLTTHAVIVGMTGSGKTGLGVALLEEAALDGVPALVIDPKGDLGNLLLTFPSLAGSDFEPWVDPAEAAREGATPSQHAANVAALWRRGIEGWGQDASRIGRFANAADRAIYTPGSSAGLPLACLRSLDAPPAAVTADGDALRERTVATVSGLLALLGLEADPIRSREHVLLSSILDQAWREGRGLDLPALIAAVQSPPLQRVGVFDVDTFFPSRDRLDLAMRLNALLAAPGFSAWMDGEPLDVARLLHSPDGRPRVSILSIAHLSDHERMFFVTILLNEVVAWMRTQPGTSSLRAVLYFDEVMGYLPPSASPPSKPPLLTLMKQARAFGLGCVLATQNPVDLDYKALSNAGTWFLGRLQTERDKERVLAGLEGVGAAGGGTFDRAATEATLAGLKSRVFLMNDVHEDEPVVFHVRWVLSYLRGPLTRAHVKKLMSARKAEAASARAPSRREASAARREARRGDERPTLPGEAAETVLPLRSAAAADDTVLYRPALLGVAKLHHVGRGGVDEWRDVALLTPVQGGSGKPDWGAARALAASDVPRGTREPEPNARFSPLPSAATRARSYTSWRKAFGLHLYRTEALVLWRSRELKELSRPGESEADFRARVAHLARERRDVAVEKLRRKQAPRIARLRDRIRRAEARIEREEAQHGHQKLSTAIAFGATVLGALVGRRAASVGTVGRASTAMRRASRTAREKEDVARARQELAALLQQLEELEHRLADELAALSDPIAPQDLELVEVRVRPRKSDIAVETFGLAWTPWRVGPDGVAESLFP